MQPSQEQEEIIHLDKNTIVISNPGTGKTTTLSWKVMKFLENGVGPENILCITFTEATPFSVILPWTDFWQ